MMSGETSESRAAYGPAVLVSLILNALENVKQVRYRPALYSVIQAS